MQKYMLHVFLAIVRHNYVGTVDAIREKKMINVICKKILDLQMEYKAPNSNQMLLDTLDDLLSRFLGIVAGLLDDSSK